MTAKIHKGEMIIPAHVASVWRAGQGARGFPDLANSRFDVPDYARLGGGQNSGAMADVKFPQHRQSGSQAGGGGGSAVYIQGPLVQAIDTQAGTEFLMRNIDRIARGVGHSFKNNPSLRPTY